MNSRSRMFVLLLVLLALTVGSASAQDDAVTVTLWSLNFAGDSEQTVQAIIEGYEAAHPNVDVAIEERSVDGHKEAMRVAINTPAAPDIYFMWGGRGLAGFYTPTGGVEPLDAYYEQYGWEDRFVTPALVATVIDGVRYGVPFNMHAMGLYYRKDLFEQAGITAEPTTYDELVEANQKLKAIGVTPFYTAGKFGWMPMRLVDSLLETFCGAELHDQLTDLVANWAEEECVTQAYTEYVRWIDEGWVPDNFLGVDPTEPPVPMFQGQAAMIYEGTWFLLSLQGAEQDMANFDFFPFPTGTDRISFFVEMWFITSTSEHKDEAAAFLDYWTSPDVQAANQGTLGILSPSAAVQIPEDADPISREWQDVVNTATGIYLPGDQAMPLEIVNLYFKVNDDVVAGVTAPDAAGAAMQEGIEEFQARQAS